MIIQLTSRSYSIEARAIMSRLHSIILPRWVCSITLFSRARCLPRLLLDLFLRLIKLICFIMLLVVLGADRTPAHSFAERNLCGWSAFRCWLRGDCRVVVIGVEKL